MEKETQPKKQNNANPAVYSEKENQQRDEDINAAKQARELPRAPDYKGQLPVSVWMKKDRNGREYLKVSFSGVVINCFQPKQNEVV